MTKAELEKKKKLARTLYMAGKDQNEIADQIDISRQTLSKWANQEGWKEQRAATSVTRPELVNKLLHSIDTLIPMSMLPVMLRRLPDWVTSLLKCQPL